MRKTHSLLQTAVETCTRCESRVLSPATAQHKRERNRFLGKLSQLMVNYFSLLISTQEIKFKLGNWIVIRLLIYDETAWTCLSIQ